MQEQILTIRQQILEAKSNGQKLLAVLLDPDKIVLENVNYLIEKINGSPATHIFVGGSIVQNNILEELISELKQKTNLPVVLFPGDPSQISVKADGILFLSLLSGRNPDYLIEYQVQVCSNSKKNKSRSHFYRLYFNRKW